MKNISCLLFTLLLIIFGKPLFAQQKKAIVKSGNPVFPGWYADPEGIIFDQTYWIYPTFSDDYGKPAPQPKLSKMV